MSSNARLTLKLFVFLFAILFVVGYVHGCKDRQNEAVLIKEIIKVASLVNHEPLYFLRGEQPRYQIVIPTDNPQFTYSLDDTNITQTIASQYSQLFISPSIRVFQARSGELAVGLLAGGVAWSIKDAADFVTKSKRGIGARFQQILSGTLGIVFGYAAGYWTATHSTFDVSNSPEVASLLAKPEVVANIKRLLWLVMHRRSLSSAHLLNQTISRHDLNLDLNSVLDSHDTNFTKRVSDSDSALFSIQKAVLRAELRVRNTSYELRNEDFAALDELIRVAPTTARLLEELSDATPISNDWILQSFLRLPREKQQKCVALFQSICRQSKDVSDDYWIGLLKSAELAQRKNAEYLLVRLEELAKTK